MLLNQHKISDIMYIRSIVESSNNKMGALPGEILAKVSPYCTALYDKLGELLDQATVKALTKDGRVTVQPTNFLRGQNFNVKGVIIDEVQNSTPSEVVTMLTRLGKFSKCFVCGDPDQCDLRGNDGAFYDLLDLFNDEESRSQGIFTFEFGPEDILRSELCKFLVKRFSLVGGKSRG
jgi:phosphate starvation-inducible PhoH-like protein